MAYTLFDDELIRNNLKPLTHTRPIADVRCGIFTMRERWEYFFQQATGTQTEAYLEILFPAHQDPYATQINASVFATDVLSNEISALQKNEKLMHQDLVIAYNGIASNLEAMHAVPTKEASVLQIKYLWDIFSLNDIAIRADFEIITKDRVSAVLSDSNTIIGNKQDVFLEPGAIVEASVLNASTGPVYIAANAEIMENCTVRGPLALCKGAQLKMGAKIYGATTLGPACKVGGEVNNSVFFANSSKAHDGFIGNSVIGEWCNIGADSNNSNLKNNYEPVKLWSETEQSFVPTGLQFCGLIMADHSKCGINTMFNTGTVVGVSCNIFGAGFPRNYIPSFSWGGASGVSNYKLNKALETMQLVFARRNKTLTELEQELYLHLYESIPTTK